MTEALETFGGRPAALVRSVANPSRLVLLLIRAVLQTDSELRGLFLQFRSESKPVDWLRDMLAPRVAVHVQEFGFDEVVDACQYLADEYHQLGEGYLIVSQDTGRVALVVSDDDMYDPGLLSRESGLVGQALRRLNPMLETAIVTSYHDRGREERVLATLTERAHQTQLLREEGDRRLRTATRAGRRDLARELSEDDPWTLLSRSGGTTGMFLRHFDLADSCGESTLTCVEGVACCRAYLGIQDMSTMNLSYDRLGVLRGSAPQAWIRDIARQLSMRARDAHLGVLPLLIDELSEDLINSAELWVADPDVYEFMRRTQGRVVPVEGAEPIGLRGRAGFLVVPHEFGVESRESMDQWEVTATLPYRLYVDLGQVQFLPLVGIARASTLWESSDL